MDWFGHLFSFVCGQDPAHTWAPGGTELPCCQRCTGLYAGALLAALFHLRFRPRLTGSFLGIHGAFLLLMVPFGYHWLSQGPMLRAMSGVVFAFGIVTFLVSPWAECPSLRAWYDRPARHDLVQSRRYFWGAISALVLVPWLGGLGGKWARWSLALMIGGGVLVFGLLATAAAWGLSTTLRQVWRQTQRRGHA